MVKESIDLTIHGLVRLRGEGLPRELADALSRDYAPFVENGSGGASGSMAELELVPLPDSRLATEVFGQRKSYLQDRYVQEHDGRLYAVRLHRGRPDCVLCLDAPYGLFFTPRKACVDAVLDMLFTGLDVVLHTGAGALLCKGAVVVRGGRAVVLAGLSGAGKTSILLHLMRDGWDYLSDNTFILRRGRALCFRRHLVMHRYHMRRFGHLFDTPKPEPYRERLLRSVLQPLIPSLPYLLQRSKKLNRMADPYLRLQPQDLRRDIQVVEEAPVGMWVCLSGGSGFDLKAISRVRMADRVQAILDLNHDDYHFFRKQCVLHWRQPLCNEEALVEQNLGDGPYYSASIPQGPSFEAHYTALHNKMVAVLDGAHPVDSPAPEEEFCRLESCETTGRTDAPCAEADGGGNSSGHRPGKSGDRDPERDQTEGKEGS